MVQLNASVTQADLVFIGPWIGVVSREECSGGPRSYPKC